MPHIGVGREQELLVLSATVVSLLAASLFFTAALRSYILAQPL